MRSNRIKIFSIVTSLALLASSLIPSGFAAAINNQLAEGDENNNTHRNMWDSVQAPTWNQLITDPAGDGGAYDVWGVDYYRTPETIGFRIRGSLNYSNMRSITYLDTDENSDTGSASSFYGGMGMDYLVQVDSVAPPTIGSLYRWNNNTNTLDFVSQLSITTDSGSYWYELPLSLLGDDGNMRVVQASGDLGGSGWIKDRAPDSGYTTTPPQLPPPAGTTVTVNAPTTVIPGSSFDATIDITNVVNFDATNYDVSFNPAVLRLDSVTDGNIGGTVIPVVYATPGAPGSFTIVQNISGLTGASGNGTLATLHFTAIGSAGQSSNITLSNGILGNTDAVEIPATWLGDVVNLLAGQLVSISVVPANPSVPRGLHRQMSAIGTYSDASTANITASVTWTSSVPGIATINSAGVATALAVGATTITATSGVISGSTVLTVTPPLLINIVVTPAYPSVAAGLTKQFTATGKYSDESTSNLTGSVTWSSSNTAAATIDAAGLATTLAAGATTISASLGPVIGTTTLTVLPPVILFISVTPVNPSINPGEQQQFTAWANWSNGASTNITSNVTWASSNPSVATINSAGMASALTIGFTTISATSGTISADTSLRVKAGNASLVLLPASQTVSVSGTFSVDIQVQTNSDLIRGVQAFLDFDPTKLEVMATTPATKWAGKNVSLIADEFDNAAGTVSYAGGVTSDVSGNITINTITFRAIDAGSTNITFHFAPPLQRDTAISDALGNSRLNRAFDATVLIQAGVAVDISVTLTGGQRPSPGGWEIPLTVKFFTANTPDVLTAQPIYSFTQTTTKSGGFAVTQVTGITPGTYDITVKGEHTLVNVKRSAVISSSMSVNMGTLLEGNAKEDTPTNAAIINIYDFGVLSGSWQKSTGEAGFIANADFDRNGIVNIYDFGLLSGNWQKSSPIEIP